MANDPNTQTGDRSLTFGVTFFGGRFYSIGDIAFALGVNTADVSKSIKDGGLVAIRVGDEAVCDGDAVNAWLADQPLWKPKP
ncbi:MAG: hypothetical protein DCC68_25290 [Planctomycetota bacterium]|nr:MAG: hypothetical protein DCC68_25290 [Planctomycetota bacterium]